MFYILDLFCVDYACHMLLIFLQKEESNIQQHSLFKGSTVLLVLFTRAESQLSHSEDHWHIQERLDGLQGDLEVILYIQHENFSC